MKVLGNVMVVFVALLVVALGGAPARAGTYPVRACLDAPKSANNSWVAVNQDPGTMVMGNGCGTTGTYQGLFVRELLGQGPNTTAATAAWWQVSAPAGTSITAIDYSRYLHIFQDEDWHPELRTDSGQVLDTCTIVYPADRCTSGADAGTRPVQEGNTARTGLNAAWLRIGARCAPTPPFTGCVRGGTLQAVIAVLYRATVTIDDPSAPTVSSLSGGLTSGAWQRGTGAVSFTGRDITGIKRLRILVDNNGTFTDDKSCNYTLPAPCATPGTDVPFSPGQIDTAALSDGTYQLRPEALDAGDNATVGPAATVRVDNTAPAAPSVASHTSSSSDGQVELSLPPQGSASPLAATWVRVCRDGGTCESDRRIPGAQAAVSYQLPERGLYTVQVWLEDEAGNRDPSQSAIVRASWAPPGSAGGGPTIGAAAGPGAGTASLPATLRPAGLRLDLDALHASRKRCRRLAVQGRTDPDATGTVTVTGTGQVGRRRYRQAVASAVSRGRWKATLPLPLKACRPGRVRRIALAVAYSGDGGFAADRIDAKVFTRQGRRSGNG